MKVTTDEFDRVLNKYIDSHIVPHLKNSFNLFKIGMLKGLGKLSVISMLEELEQIGAYCENDETIDIEVLREGVDGGFDYAEKVTLFGIVFDRNDAEKFFNMF